MGRMTPTVYPIIPLSIQDKRTVATHSVFYTQCAPKA